MQNSSNQDSSGKASQSSLNASGNHGHSVLNSLITLIKREFLEHKNLWRVPVVLLIIAVLLKLSLSFGNLSVNVNIPDALSFDEAIDSVVNSAVIKTLSVLNYFVMIVMLIVAVFYALSCLYEERRDDSVLFWRSLPISDGLTIASKLLIPLLFVPLIILLCHAINSVIFLGSNVGGYLGDFYIDSSIQLGKKMLWSILPVIAWCMFCSSVAKRNPFLMAFIAPILFILIDYLFFNGNVSEVFIINRLTGVSEFSILALITGFIFSVVCIAIAIFKRAQKV